MSATRHRGGRSTLDLYLPLFRRRRHVRRPQRAGQRCAAGGDEWPWQGSDSVILFSGWQASW